MSEQYISWFHCGRCGSLFQSPVGESENRLCSTCGNNPSLGIELSPTAALVSPNFAPESATEKTQNYPSRTKKRSFFMVKLVSGWLLLLVAIVLLARWLWPEDRTEQKPFVSAAAAKSVVPAEDLALLSDAGPLCSQVFTNFLAAGTPEERNQFVFNPISTAARMARFYGLNPLASIDPQTLILTHNAVLHLPAGRAIETYWSTQDGRKLDAVFVEENGEWHLDWDHYARYSEYPWALFLADTGDLHGEFRLLARERLAEERKNADTLSIVLYAPRFGSTSDTGFQSPEFLIKRDSKNGRLLDAAFKLEKGGARPFGVNLPSNNPEGLIRVRVKVHRVEESIERRFEIDEVIACHWYSVDAPGVEIPEQPAKK